MIKKDKDDCQTSERIDMRQEVGISHCGQTFKISLIYNK